MSRRITPVLGFHIVNPRGKSYIPLKEVIEDPIEQPLGIIANVKAFVSKIGKAIEDYFDYHEKD